MFVTVAYLPATQGAGPSDETAPDEQQASPRDAMDICMANAQAAWAKTIEAREALQAAQRQLAIAKAAEATAWRELRRLEDQMEVEAK